MATKAPWVQTQLQELLQQRGHAWLLHGPSGLGQYGLALELARAWLCEQPGPAGACGHCRSCHAIDVRTHADLEVLMPETVLMERDWPLPDKARQEIDDKKRKASREIRVEAMRDAVEFAQRTSAAGRGKVVLVYPAERMNAVTANALLKTLEEPPGDVRFLLATEAAHRLLPTIRSRCLAWAMRWPDESSSQAWLLDQGMDEQGACTWLRAAGGRPDAALALMAQGRDAAAWSRLPQAVRRADVAALRDWPMAEVVDALQKICHDLQRMHVGAEPRFFAAADLPKPPAFGVLSRWGRDLAQTARTVDHPFNAGLMLEALLADAKSVLHSARS